MVSAPPADTLAETLRPLTENPGRAAVLCDIDGTLAPIVERSEEAHVREEISLLLGRLGRRYRCVACVSGRAATEARRLVGVGSIVYVGSHGAELLEPGSTSPSLVPAWEGWEARVRRFMSDHHTGELRRLRVRAEDKRGIAALHWRGVPDEEAARTLLEQVAQAAEGEGLATHWGRKVLEVRPRAALFGGDDTTDLDAFDALEALRDSGELETAVRVGVRSDEGPAAIIERADVVVDGVEGFALVLHSLAED